MSKPLWMWRLFLVLLQLFLLVLVSLAARPERVSVSLSAPAAPESLSASVDPATCVRAVSAAAFVGRADVFAQGHSALRLQQQQQQHNSISNSNWKNYRHNHHQQHDYHQHQHDHHPCTTVGVAAAFCCRSELISRRSRSSKSKSPLVLFASPPRRTRTRTKAAKGNGSGSPVDGRGPTSSSSSTGSFPVWFLLVDETGNAFKGSGIDFVERSEAPFVAKFRDAVKTKFAGNRLKDVDPSDLKVYANESSFRSKEKSPLEADAPVSGLGRSTKKVIYVVVPVQEQAAGAVLRIPPSISVTNLLEQNSLPGMEFVEAMKQPLGFKIPIFDSQSVSLWPDSFTQGKAEYGVCIDKFLEYTIVGNSELSIVSFDSLWLELFMKLCSCTIYRDESHGSSSRQGSRPDAIVVKGNVLVGKCEAKASQQQINTATLELTDKMADAAYVTFPYGTTSIPAWSTCSNLIQLHQLSYNPSTKSYETKLLKTYHMTYLDHREQFVVDLFKIMKWVIPIEKPNALMHLFPEVRTITPNGHYVTWLKNGLFKQFKTGAEIDMDIIQHIYSADLQHVERGTCNHASVTITSIGQTLQNALVHFQGNRQSIIDQVKSALEELHNIGVAHCDVRAANVFVLLGDKRVILGDLEYCRPSKAAPPNVKIFPKNKPCKTAEELDLYQFEVFKDELARM